MRSLLRIKPWPLAAFALWLLAETVARGASVSYVVHLSLDGLGAKYLEWYVTNAPAQFPNFNRLKAEGACTFNARCDYDYSETVPNHATMFTGRPVSQPTGAPDTTHHGYSNNFPDPGETLHNAGNSNVLYKASFFDVAHDHGLPTALYTGKTRLAICERSYNDLNGALDLFGEDNGRDKIDFASVADVSGTNIAAEVDLLLQDLTNAAPRRYSFMHIAEPDLTGHSSGWGSANWSNAVRNVDTQIGRILDAIKANPVLSDSTAFIAAADHGGGGVIPNAHTEAYHITNYTIPFFLWGPGVPAGVDLYSLFSNRADPGTNRTGYSQDPQPLRNGDAANLALALLGLPPIPDSYHRPVAPFLNPVLSITRLENTIMVTWPASADGFSLEYSRRPGEGIWQRITNDIAAGLSQRVFVVNADSDQGPGFFRLRGRAFSINAHPQSVSVFRTQPATFRVGVNGPGPFTYQWSFKGVPIDGAVGSVLTVDGAEPDDAGDYDVVVSDGLDSQRSRAASLSVLTAPRITQQPQEQLVASNAPAQFTVHASGAGMLGYQWRKDGIEVEGATGSSLLIPNTQLGDQGQYSVVVSDVNGSAESQGARLAVLIPPVFVIQPASQTASLGQSVTFSVGVVGSPLPFGFQWFRGSVSVASNTVYSSNATLTIPEVRTNDAGSYRVIVRNQALPVGRASNPALLSIQP